MIYRFPLWVWIGAWVLAFTAGTINVIGFLGAQHEAITHLTGSTSLFASALALGNISQALHFFGLISSFVFGAVVSGFIVQDSVLKLGHRYSVALLLVSLLLFVSAPLFELNVVFGMYAAACACGLQNAMVSTYSGAVVRTTHLSGMFTDLGVFLGHALRGLPVEKKRLWLSLLVISGFLCGGIVGTFAFNIFSYSAILFPAGVTAVMAIAYAIYQARQARFSDQ